MSRPWINSASRIGPKCRQAVPKSCSQSSGRWSSHWCVSSPDVSRWSYRSGPIPISSSRPADGGAPPCLIGQQADLLALRPQMPKGIQRTWIRRRSVMQYACGVEDETVIVIRECGDAVHYRGSRRRTVGHGWCSRLGTDRRSFPRYRAVRGDCGVAPARQVLPKGSMTDPLKSQFEASGITDLATKIRIGC